MNTKNLCEEEITLAPQTEIFEEAKRIAAESAGDATDSFVIKYDANQKDFLIAVLTELGCIITAEKDEPNNMTVTMNMEQLGFMKTLDCIECVKEKSSSIMNNEEKEIGSAKETKATTVQVDSETLNNTNVATASAMAFAFAATAETAETASVQAVTETEGSSMETAIPLTLESWKDGCICCPCAEVWYKFTVPENKNYTIHTKGLLDTMGYLYDADETVLYYNDDLNGRTNFKIVASLYSGQTYYIKVKAYAYNIGCFSIRVTKNILVDYVTVTPKNVIIEADKTVQLSASVYPETASDKRIFWYCFDHDIVDVDYRTGLVTPVGEGTATVYAYDWFEYGRRGQCSVTVEAVDNSIHVTSFSVRPSTKIMYPGDFFELEKIIRPASATDKSLSCVSSNTKVASIDPIDGFIDALSPGEAIITARTTDGGFTDSCTVTVLSDLREAVAIEQDDEGVYEFYKITFQDGLVWRSVGADEDELGLLSHKKHKARSDLNMEQDFSDDQLALLYRLDPLGVVNYVKWRSINEGETTAEHLFYKDRIYKAIFGDDEVKQKRFYFKIINDTVVYGDYVGFNRTKVYSNAEVLFGSHLSVDWSNFWKDIAEIIFGLIPGVSDVILGIEVIKAMFFSGSIVGSAEGVASTFLDKYIQEYDETALGKKVSMLFFGWPRTVFDIASSFVDAITPENINDITIYSKIEENPKYRLVFDKESTKISMRELIEHCVIE